jgi:hypothetical protein
MSTEVSNPPKLCQPLLTGMKRPEMPQNVAKAAIDKLNIAANPAVCEAMSLPGICKGWDRKLQALSER